MKKMKLAVLALALSGIFAAGNAMAVDTTVNVSATVTDACIATTTQDITIGAIDPTTTTGTISSASHPGSTPGQINVVCTAGMVVNFSGPGGSVPLTGTTNGDIMNVVPILPAGPATPGITGANYTVNATVDQSEYTGVSADTYNGSFVVTVAP